MAVIYDDIVVVMAMITITAAPSTTDDTTTAGVTDNPTDVLVRLFRRPVSVVSHGDWLVVGDAAMDWVKELVGVRGVSCKDGVHCFHQNPKR